jgi:hypothetical protein
MSINPTRENASAHPKLKNKPIFCRTFTADEKSLMTNEERAIADAFEQLQDVIESLSDKAYIFSNNNNFHNEESLSYALELAKERFEDVSILLARKRAKQ